MDFWTPMNLAAVLQGTWLREPAEPNQALSGLGIDSRAVSAGQAFLAFRGERFDGHDFIDEVFAAGAALAIVSDREKASQVASPHARLLHVPDTLAALQQLACAWRDRLHAAGTRIIAVSGSNGKTTTRHLIHTVLSARFTGMQSPRSFNNHIGVPLTLLQARPEDRFAVVEIGSNHPGEVAQLARIVRPDAGVVVSIGREHMEFFRSVENVAREELSLLDHVVEGGLAVVPAARLLPADIAVTAPAGLTLVTFDEDAAVPPSLPLLGEHSRHNAAAAAAVARWMGLDDATIGQALRQAEPIEGRLQTMRFGHGVTVIHDAYNANPDSMQAALDVLVSTPAARRVAVLGDMFELGESGPDEHRNLGERIGELGDAIGLVVLIGRLSLFAAEALSRSRPPEQVHMHPAWDDDLPRQIADLLCDGDLVLLKASRGMRLERLLPAIEARFGHEVK